MSSFFRAKDREKEFTRSVRLLFKFDLSSFLSHFDLVLSRVKTLTDQFGERSSFSYLGSLKNSHYFDNLQLSFMKELLAIFGFSLKL